MTTRTPDGLAVEDWILPALESERQEPVEEAFEVEEAEPLPKELRVIKVAPGSFICGRC